MVKTLNFALFSICIAIRKQNSSNWNMADKCTQHGAHDHSPNPSGHSHHGNTQSWSAEEYEQVFTFEISN